MGRSPAGARARVPASRAGHRPAAAATAGTEPSARTPQARAADAPADPPRAAARPEGPRRAARAGAPVPVALSHEVHGDGPGLVLLHGVGLDRRMWDRCLPALAARHRVTLVDLRGHGDSPPAAAGVSLAELAADVGALLSGPTHVVGFSLGALVAQRLGLDRPDLTASLTLVSSVADRSAEERAAVARRQELAAQDFGASARAAVDRWFSPAWREREPQLARQVLDTLLANDRACYLACYRVFGTADGELWPGLPRIAAPTVAVTGERDPGSTPAMSHRLAERIPGGRAVIVAGARHLLPLECPQELTDVILAHTGNAAGNPTGAPAGNPSGAATGTPTGQESHRS
ncbi:alpha/beta fold hydrolase [Streptomyces luomodiensis]|uniref:Alpha/beta fold hydrolase n=1 Tax=Streptomyces luomodiensis TaxID=3026192 RepID=A0ABY9UPV7_9ACTN|nr:alpha/beta fold hydrolase [Streptomyces sp. SCA4-21]WNE94592.1 alpha/beta fold hydrolase [Streptomyces sp. SCA4-21]